MSHSDLIFPGFFSIFSFFFPLKLGLTVTQNYCYSCFFAQRRCSDICTAENINCHSKWKPFYCHKRFQICWFHQQPLE